MNIKDSNLNHYSSGGFSAKGSLGNYYPGTEVMGELPFLGARKP